MLPEPRLMLEFPKRDATASVLLFKSHEAPFMSIELMSLMISLPSEIKLPPARVMVPLPASRLATFMVLVCALRKMFPLPVLVAFKPVVLTTVKG